MINDELRPIVIEFVAEMLNDPRCESILLDAGEDAMVGSGQSVLYLDVAGKRYGCTLTVVGDEYSVGIRDSDMDEMVTTTRGRKRAWELQKLLTEIKTKLWEDK